MLKKIALLAASSVCAFAMHSAQININEKDLELGARFDVGQFNHAVEPNTVFIGGKFLKADGDYSDPKTYDLESLYEANFLMQREVGRTGFTFGLGVKLVRTEDFTSIPLGIEAKYRLPFSRIIPLYAGGSFYYAPEALALEDAHSYKEYRITLDIEVIKNANITMGYRKIDTDYEVGRGKRSFEYNSAPFIGFKFLF